MRVTDLLLMSITSLWKRKLRTVLTVLGVVIGTISIVVMIALGNGLKQSILDDISQYSSMTQINLSSGSMWGNTDSSTETKLLSDQLIRELEAMEHVVKVYPQLSVSVLAKTGKYESYMQLRGVTTEELQTLNIPIAQGNLPKEDEQLSFFYGNNVLTNFYIAKTGTYPYWDKNEMPDVDLMNAPVFIIFDMDAYWSSQNSSSGGQGGTTQKKAPKKYLIKTAGVMEGNPDEWTSNSGSVFCEIEALKAQLKKVFKKNPIPGQPTRKNGKPYNEIFYTQLILQVDDMENVVALSNTLKDMGYEAYNSAEWIQSQMTQLNYIQAVLGAIGAVSLLVAAIGITNTMMMSIYERTKEIGVMKVLGCDIHNIQALFLLEAGFIGFLGGAIGVLFSYGLSLLINQLLLGNEMGLSNICRIPSWLSPVAIAFAILIGMVAGFLPSLRAMKLSPLAAIRNE